LNLQSVCLLGLLRSPEQLESLLKLLADPVREEAEKIVSSLKPLKKAEQIQQWARLREKEWLDLGEMAWERTGVSLDKVAPTFRMWFVSWLVDQT
jgi:hypothetical protein